MSRTHDKEPTTNQESSFEPNLPGVTPNKLTRRDFIKLAIGATGAGFLAACGVKKVLAPAFTDPTSFPGTEINPNAAVENQVVFGSGEFITGDSSLSDTLKNSLREGFNIEIPEGSTIPFSLKVGEAKFDFISLAPLENTELGISWNDKLFIRVNDTLADLDRQEVTIDGNNLIMWSYLNTNNNRMEPVLWYPALTTQQWESLTPEQKSNFYAGFAPPSPLEGQIPGYTRTLDQIFTIAFGELPENALKVRAALMPIELRPAAEALYYQDAFVLQPESPPEIEGVSVDFKLIVNKSLVDRQFLPIQGLVPNENYISTEGRRWDEAIADYILDYEYQAWKEQNSSSMSQAEWYKMVAAYQTGTEYNGQVPTFDDVAIEVGVDDFLTTMPNRNKVISVVPGDLEIVFCNSPMNHLQQLRNSGVMGFGFSEENSTLRIFVGVLTDLRFGMAMVADALRAIEIAFFPERFSRLSSPSYSPEGENKVLYRNSSSKEMIPLEPFPTDWMP